MEKSNQLKIDVREDFNVPVDMLYKAWTEPDQLKAWWKPMNNHLSNVTNELKDGGSIDYQFEGNKLHITGKYSEVKENDTLVYSWNWEMPLDQVRNADYQLTVKFESKDGGSSISVIQDAFEDEEAMTPHEDGWKKGLAELKEYLSGKK